MTDEAPQHVAENSAMFSNKTYDRLKFVAQIFLPALGTFYFALSVIWHWPKGEEVVGSITAADVFLGVLLGISSKSYNEAEEGEAPHVGFLEANGADEDTGMPNLKMVITAMPDEILSSNEVRLKIGPPPPQGLR